MNDFDMRPYINYKSATVVAPPGAVPPAFRAFHVLDRRATIPSLTKLDPV
jgi:hypothetical protein